MPQLERNPCAVMGAALWDEGVSGGEATWNAVVLVTQPCPTLCDPMDGARQAPLFTGFSRQEYWSGLPFPSPGNLLNPGIEPRSPALQADSSPEAMCKSRENKVQGTARSMPWSGVCIWKDLGAAVRRQNEAYRAAKDLHVGILTLGWLVS